MVNSHIVIIYLLIFSQVNESISPFSTGIKIDDELILRRLPKKLKIVKIGEVPYDNIYTKDFLILSDKADRINKTQSHYIGCSKELIVFKGSKIVLQGSFNFMVYGLEVKTEDGKLGLPIFTLDEGRYYIYSNIGGKEDCYYRILELKGQIGISIREIGKDLEDKEDTLIISKKFDAALKKEGISEENLEKNICSKSDKNTCDKITELLSNIIWFSVGYRVCKSGLCTEVSGIEVVSKCEDLKYIEKGDVIISADGRTISRDAYFDLSSIGKKLKKIGILRDEKVKIIEISK